MGHNMGRKRTASSVQLESESKSLSQCEQVRGYLLSPGSSLHCDQALSHCHDALESALNEDNVLDGS